ncbi:MAG: transketolase family protein [Bifidobacteriaceae bacterium]|jgi:transketolase|nr:transketolase family protein [Bifidobacteriaceae bacterium]
MNAELFDCRVAFAETLIELAETDERVVVVVNDSVGSSNLAEFQRRFPERTINVGIAEQTMVGVGAGLALSGRIPFVSAAASFLTGRATEQIKVDAAYANTNVKLCGQSPGMGYGALGATHHSIEDISWLRALPGLTIIVPADPAETSAAVRWMAAHEGPVYLRVSRLPVPNIFDQTYRFSPGRGRVVRDGPAATVVANGVCLTRALEAANLLAEQGVEIRVVSMPSVQPLDEDLVLACAAATGRLVTVEEGQVSGGLGAAVASLLAVKRPTPMRILGVPGVFAPTGSEPWLLDHFGMDPAGIAAAVRELL